MEVKMSMDEYKRFERYQKDYERLTNRIKQCAETRQEKPKQPIGFNQEYQREQVVTTISLEKLTNVLMEEVRFCEYQEVDRIIYSEIQGKETKQ